MSSEPGARPSRTAGRGTPTVGTPGGRSVTGEPGLGRAFAQSPLAVAVVRGPTHTLAYANTAFQMLAEGATALGAPTGLAFGTPLAAVLPPAVARPLLAVLNHVRQTEQPERGTMPAAASGTAGMAADAPAADAPAADAGGADAWPFTAWPAAGARAGSVSDALVLAVDTSREAADTRAQQRTIAERLLLSAFREGTRADDADVARGVAEDANAARGRALAATSHELRTPLQAISGYAEILDLGLHGPVTDAQHATLARIQQAMQHLLGVTTTLLHQSQAGAGPVAYAITDVLAAVVLHEAVALVTPQAAARGIALMAGPCAMTVVGRADAGKLRQVLVNLLANAVKFTSAGGTVTAACAFEAEDAPADMARRREDQEVHAGGRVVLRVTDTGIGIAADQLARVFEAYVQVGPRLTTRDAGVGLGLAISRELARGMAGDLTVESTPGVGSTFTLTLPAA